MKNFYSFVYLDKDSVDDLYSQVFEDDVVEKFITNSNEDITDIDINANLLNVFGSQAKNSENNTFLENVKIVTSTARKAQLLINRFKTDKMSLQDIIKDNKQWEESIYFIGKSTFFLKDIYNKETGKSIFLNNCENFELSENSILILETGDDYYIEKYKRTGYPSSPYIFEAMMHVSNIKIKKDVRHLTSVIQQRNQFNFFVFGQIIHNDNKFYKISPFAIWQ